MSYRYTLFEDSRSPVTLSPENTNIKNSFEVSFDAIPDAIHGIRTEALNLRDDDLAIFHRSERSMVTEWQCGSPPSCVTNIPDYKRIRTK